MLKTILYVLFILICPILAEQSRYRPWGGCTDDYHCMYHNPRMVCVWGVWNPYGRPPWTINSGCAPPEPENDSSSSSSSEEYPYDSDHKPRSIPPTQNKGILWPWFEKVSPRNSRCYGYFDYLYTRGRKVLYPGS